MSKSVQVQSNCYPITIELDEVYPENSLSCSGDILYSPLTKFDEEDEDAVEFQAAMQGIESFVLALACAGIDITTPNFAEALETAVEACSNNLD